VLALCCVEMAYELGSVDWAVKDAQLLLLRGRLIVV
jgi:hypothetical protein